MAVPASSAPVKRVFSHGRVIILPYRSQLSDQVLSYLIFFANAMHCKLPVTRQQDC